MSVYPKVRVDKNLYIYLNFLNVRHEVFNTPDNMTSGKSFF